MLTIDEIIQVLNDILRESIPSTDKIKKIRNFVDGLEEDQEKEKVGGDSD
jgi:hypothetical protein